MQSIHRPTVGIIALVLMCAAAWMGYTGEHHGGLFAGCLRVGTVMAMLWLALPESVPPVNLWVLAGALIFLMYLGKMPVAVRWILIIASPLLLIIFWPQVRRLITWWKEGKADQAKARKKKQTSEKSRSR